METSTVPSLVSGYIPEGETSHGAFRLARDSLSEPILNHSLRVYLIAKGLAEKEGSIWATPAKLPLLFVAAICHDLGASELYDGEQRFEVEGADAAKAHLLSRGTSEEHSHSVWTAIAVHTSPGIAERIDPLSRLIRLGVLVDFSASKRAEMEACDYCSEIERHFPRLEVEKALADAVVKQAGKIEGSVDSKTWPNTQKHPSASWPGILLRAHVENPGWDGVNPAF